MVFIMAVIISGKPVCKHLFLSFLQTDLLYYCDSQNRLLHTILTTLCWQPEQATILVFIRIKVKGCNVSDAHAFGVQHFQGSYHPYDKAYGDGCVYL